MNRLRVIGDVHGQLDGEELATPGRRPYSELIADVAYSVQVGDMGDAETYEQLGILVDPVRHRFVPGNHDHYDCLPAHSLGDFGEVTLGGVSFFFIRGAASVDREKLITLGARLGRTLWFEGEELTEGEMRAAEVAYRQCSPAIVVSHDGPTEAAQAAFREAFRHRWCPPLSSFVRSRTNRFLDRLLALHRPRLWLFGHHHHNWSGWDGTTHFVCVGELCWGDITPAGKLLATGGAS